MSQLVIAEKPSVAQALAKVLGASNRKDGYLEGNGYFVSWCVGHLVELAAADAYDPRYSKWVREDLPIVPEPWQFRISAATKKQFGVLKALMHRVDVESLVCATDAGREGELIFRLTYHLADCKKPFTRLWISSMEDSAIAKGFEHLLAGSNYDNLYAAALCRAKADWLVGINATRLFTTLYNGKTLNVGRVMTPTLALLTDREAAIADFQKQKFYTVELNFGTARAVSERINSKTDAEKLRIACMGKPVTVQTVERQEKAEKPPKLYDLTTLQREANRLYGYTAQQTLDYVQLLYEKKLTTYPRTDSQFLTEDMAAGLPSLCERVAAVLPFVGGIAALSINAPQVVDNSKVSDHHAIIPTMQIVTADLAALPTGERNVLHLIATRLLCAVGEKYRYAETAVTLDCGGTVFATKGRVTLAEGWRTLEQLFKANLKEKPEKEKGDAVLPPFTEGQTVTPAEIATKEGATTAPKRFSEDSLLAAMENAGAEDFAEIENLERKGLGTPATRAGVIEKLVKGGFAERQKKQLVPTEKGMALTKVLPDSIKSAKLTAEWETALKQVEQGAFSPDAFMDGIIQMTADLVKAYAGVNVGTSALSGSDKATVGKCPRCGKEVVEGKKSFYCVGYNSNPPCGFVLWKDNKYFQSKRKELTKKVAAALLKDGRAYMTGLFSEKKGILYDATIVIDDTGGKYVNFKLEFQK